MSCSKPAGPAAAAVPNIANRTPSAPLQAPVWNPAIARLIEESSRESNQILSVIDTVLKHLLENNLAYRAQIPPSLVGVSPKNRDGYGLSPIRVHSVGTKIAKLGFSWDACNHAVCIEDDRKSEIANYSAEISRKNPGLGPLLKSNIKYGSLSCSHTNNFLVAANAGVASNNTLLAIDNRLSASLIGGRDPQFKEALDKGLHWVVLKAEVAEFYPEFCHMLQHGKNAIGDVQQRESEVQLMMNIQQAAEDMSRKSGNIDWKKLVSIIANRNDQSPADAKSYVEFVRRWGGGAGGKFVHDLHRFDQLCVEGNRIISTSTIETLAYLKVSVENTCPFFVLSIIKAQACCPDTFVRDKVCMFITKSDIASLAGVRQSAMVEAEKVLKICHQMADTAEGAGRAC